MTRNLHPAWLEAPETKTLVQAFAQAGAPLRFVGGCVRDSLLGRAVKDVDVATPLHPEKTMALLKAAGISVIPTGLQHGTVTAVIQHRPFEITTLRKDTACDGRHAEVAFTDDWQEDAARRDFTVNALYLSPAGEMFDYFGGLADLEREKIKFIGDATARIREDYLRILRFFRFLATHGQPPADAAALAACKEAAQHIGTLSGERIQHEMAKLLAAPDPAYALEQMQQSGVFAVVLGAVVTRQPLEQLLALERAQGAAPQAYLRLALLLRSARTDALAPLVRRWKLSNADAATLKLYVTHELIALDENFRALKRVIRRRGNEAAMYLLLRDAAENASSQSPTPSPQPLFVEALALARTWQAPEFPVTGQDLLALGINEGPELGKRLREMEEIWEKADYKPSKQELINTIK